MTDVPVYTSRRPDLAPTSDELRARIPGWGVDLDPADRPAVPRERFDPAASGAHWDFPERQDELRPRERSIEHRFLTPVFGTAQPTRGLSGVIRKFAYSRFSEARASHWLLLIAADRVNVAEARVTSALAGQPDDIIGETGVYAEKSRHGVASRVGQGRSDVNHQWIDPILVAAPYVAAGLAAVWAVRRLSHR